MWWCHRPVGPSEGEGLQKEVEPRRDVVLVPIHVVSNTTSPRSTRGWAHTFVCLDAVGWSSIPTTALEKDRLIAAGLGEQRVSFANIDCSAEKLWIVLSCGYDIPGGISSLNAPPTPGSWETLSLRSPRDLQRCGSARTYIRPLQRDLDTSRDPALLFL